MRTRTLFFLVSVCLLAGRPAAAQDAVLSCSVVDTSNAPVPGAAAILKNVATGITTESISNGQGLVSFPSARPGVYELTITLDGFAPVTVTALRLEVGENRAVTAKLNPVKYGRRSPSPPRRHPSPPTVRTAAWSLRTSSFRASL